jgi:hypothetical protein
VREQLEARLKAGDSFAAAAAAVGQGQVKLAVKIYPPFIRRQPPKDIGLPVLSALEHLEQGQVSDMLIDQDQGCFVHAKEKKRPDLTEINPQYVATRAQLAQLDARLVGGLCLSEIVARELKRSGVSETAR